MLLGIDPLLSADLLHALRAMGHGDTIAIVDANFPAATCARRLIMAPGCDADPMLRAVLSVLPIDDFVTEPLVTMQVVDDPAAVPLAVAVFRTLAGVTPMGSVARHDFYIRARAAFAIVQTGDQRAYANIILTKGVIGAR
ncbi:RbsD/FucU family protein [Acidiphilium sp.]|uniref:RbsD/FucU family protein n=1 Tax=Acidiphilium sp. TaxID=527 RepID=UPI003CFCD875